MKIDALHRIAKLLRYSTLAAATLYVVVYLAIGVYRVQYPFELEWLEGSVVDHVRRILCGQRLYVSPSLEFVPYIYTPLYFYVSAFVSKIVGIGFLPLRLTSYVASVGSFAIIFRIVREETSDTISAILASGLFAATFRLSGAWFDIARVDSLFLFLLLLALYVIRFHTSRRSYVIAGLVVCLAFLTKQVALVIALPVMLYCIVVNWRRSVLFIGTTAVTIGGSTLILNSVHSGWYNYYIFELPTRWNIAPNWLLGFWVDDLLRPLPIACAMSALYLGTRLRRATLKRDLFWLVVAIGMLGGAWSNRLFAGAYDNVLFPAYAVVSILFGLAWHCTGSLLFRVESTNRRKVLRVLVNVACLLQFACLAYDPIAQVPTQEDLQAGRVFINTMSQIEGDILVPSHGFLPTLAGKQSSAHSWAIHDVFRDQQGAPRATLATEIRESVAEQRFAVIILDSDWFQVQVEHHYERQGTVFDDQTVFWPVTGKRTRPEFIYVPKNGDPY